MSATYTLETLPRVPQNTTKAEEFNVAYANRDSGVIAAQNRFMKASELIAILQKQIAAMGDLPVVITTQDIGFVVAVAPRATREPVVPMYNDIDRPLKLEEMTYLESIRLEIGTNWSITL